MGHNFNSLTFFNLARWGGLLTPRPGRPTPGREVRYQLYSSLGGSWDRLDGQGKPRPHWGWNPGTFIP
jgi:hypothetical protein